jgi:four helix bundle protein
MPGDFEFAGDGDEVLKMKNSKHQIPNSKQIPNPKFQSVILPTAAFESWETFDTASAAMILREGAQSSGNGHPYDLEERTAQFGEAVIRFIKKVPRNPPNDRLIGQLPGCATSVGANYREANEPVSRKDFLLSIGRCLKEAKETQFFLRMIATSEPHLATEARALYREAKEFVLIFSSMRRK